MRKMSVTESIAGVEARRFRGFGGVAFALVVLAGCSRGDVPPGERSAPSREIAAATRPGLAAAAKPPAVVGPRPPTLMGRLEQEAQARPRARPRAEAVLEAARAAGAVLGEVKQHLGGPVGAAYCVGARTQHGVSLSVCEYSDETAARQGSGTSTSTFGAIAHREVLQRGTTTLTLLQSPHSPDSEDQAGRLRRAFDAL